MKLQDKDFLIAVKNNPLISIDLIIRDVEGRILLGLRENRPAQNFWFVPGGRILKNEHLSTAFQRVTRDELGLAYDIHQSQFLGVFEHIYEDNYMGVDGFGTHYVVLGCALTLSPAEMDLRLGQHRQWRWWQVAELLAAEDVHPYTKAYFGDPALTLVFKGNGYDKKDER